MSTRASPPRAPGWHCLRLAAQVVALLAVGQASAASVAAPPASDTKSVVVVAPQCKTESFRPEAFVDSLRVELAGSGLSCCTLARPEADTGSVPSLRVRIELVPCTTDADRVQVAVHAPEDPRMVAREVFLADVERVARPRALALAVAELIRSRRQDVRGTVPQTTLAPAPRSVPSITPLPSKAAQPVAVSVRVEAEARRFPTRETTTWGGRAGLTARWSTLYAEFDLGGSSARAQDALGDVTLRSASAGLGLGPRFALRPAIVDLGLRAELGWAWIRGEPALQDVRAGGGSDLTSSVGLRWSLELPARAMIRPRLGLEGGGVIRAMEGEANAEPVVGVAGYYLLAAAGMAISL
ncbi:MAG: hypothetical protein JW940_18630 [Polyangiaceae bacterium]|nr:hypothetical protein [Polyangiaceae bacterium]